LRTAADELESSPGLISAEAAVAMEVGTEQNRAFRNHYVKLDISNLVDIFAQDAAARKALKRII